MADRMDEATGDRLARLESNLEAVMNNVNVLASRLEEYASDTRSQIQTISQSIADRGRAPWPTLIAAAMLIVAIVGGIGSGYVRDLTTLQEDVGENRAAIVGHRTDGHVQAISATAAAVDGILAWQHEHTERYAREHGRNESRLETLEREVFQAKGKR